MIMKMHIDRSHLKFNSQVAARSSHIDFVVISFENS